MRSSMPRATTFTSAQHYGRSRRCYFTISRVSTTRCIHSVSYAPIYPSTHRLTRSRSPYLILACVLYSYTDRLCAPTRCGGLSLLKTHSTRREGDTAH